MSCLDVSFVSPKVVVSRIAVAVAVLAAAGCGGKHHLEQYQFSNRTLGLVYVAPPEPELLNGSYNVNGQTPLQTVMRATGTVAKEVVARRASARLDTATRRLDVSKVLAVRTVERVSRYLGTTPAAMSNNADYLLEITMRSFGIDARSNTATYLYTRAEAVLIDRRSGREIWSVSVRGSDRLTAWVRGSPNLPSSVINAGTLATVTVQDLQDALDQLATYTSNLITEELRDKLRDVR